MDHAVEYFPYLGLCGRGSTWRAGACGGRDGTTLIGRIGVGGARARGALVAVEELRTNHGKGSDLEWFRVVL